MYRTVAVKKQMYRIARAVRLREMWESDEFLFTVPPLRRLCCAGERFFQGISARGCLWKRALQLLMAEIRPLPVEVGRVIRLSHYLQGFVHPRWFSRRISEPSTVVDYEAGDLKEARNLTTWAANVTRKGSEDASTPDPNSSGVPSRLCSVLCGASWGCV